MLRELQAFSHTAPVPAVVEAGSGKGSTKNSKKPDAAHLFPDPAAEASFDDGFQFASDNANTGFAVAGDDGFGGTFGFDVAAPVASAAAHAHQHLSGQNHHGTGGQRLSFSPPPPSEDGMTDGFGDDFGVNSSSSAGRPSSKAGAGSAAAGLMQPDDDADFGGAFDTAGFGTLPSLAATASAASQKGKASAASVASAADRASSARASTAAAAAHDHPADGGFGFGDDSDHAAAAIHSSSSDGSSHSDSAELSVAAGPEAGAAVDDDAGLSTPGDSTNGGNAGRAKDEAATPSASFPADFGFEGETTLPASAPSSARSLDHDGQQQPISARSQQSNTVPSPKQPATPNSAAPAPSTAAAGADDFGFDADFGSDSNPPHMQPSSDAAASPPPLPSLPVSPAGSTRSAAAAAAMTTPRSAYTKGGFRSAPASGSSEVPITAMATPAQVSAASVSTPKAATPAAAGGIDDFESFGSPAVAAAGASGASTGAGAMAAPASNSSGPVSFVEAEESGFESFGFGSSEPQRAATPPPPVPEAPRVPVQQQALAPQSVEQRQGPVVGSNVDIASLPPLQQPAAPRLQLSEITALRITWDAVPGASGYYVDYEPRSVVGSEDEVIATKAIVTTPPASAGRSGRSSASIASNVEWLGAAGGRALCNGSTLIPGTSARIGGLMKNSFYAVRVSAVRSLPITLPGGHKSSIVQESDPSPPCQPFFRTLNPGQEIVRLQTTNARLTHENERIPGLEAEVERLGGVLASTQGQLGDARSEIVRLTDALNGKSQKLHASQVENTRLVNLLAARDATIAGDTAEIMRLTNQVEGLESERRGCSRCCPDVALVVAALC